MSQLFTSGGQSVLLLLMTIPGLISFRTEWFSENKDLRDIYTLPCIKQKQYCNKFNKDFKKDPHLKKNEVNTEESKGEGRGKK